MAEHVRSSIEGGVLTLRLDRPEKKNALTRAMYGALSAVLAMAARDDAVRVVLLAGGADFTAGNDIGDFAGPAEGVPRVSAAFDFLEALAGFPKPLVATVRGVAIGVGTTLLLHCDAAVAARDARLQMPFTRLGVVPEAGSSLLLGGFLGQARASWLLLSGEPMDGATAAEAGLVTRAVEDAEVEAAAAAMAATLAALPPGAVAETKRLIRTPHRAALAASMAAEREAFAARLKTAEAQAIFAAFLAKSGGR